MSTADIADLGKFYSADKFYAWQVHESYRSAKIYCAHLFALYQPKSVVDFGCGRGAWLKAMLEQGAEKAVGLDGPWNSQEAMIDQTIEFRPTDLNDPAPSVQGQRFDLAQSLEVFEHLEEKNADRIVAAFAACADVLMFGAALPHQGGENHINEQPHSYWAEKLLSHGFEVYDYFRPTFWGDKEVAYYYRQDTYLYVRQGHPLGAKLRELGYAPIRNLGFMNMVHPDLLDHWVSLTAARRIRYAIADVTPEPVKKVARAVRDLVKGRG